MICCLPTRIRMWYARTTPGKLYASTPIKNVSQILLATKVQEVLFREKQPTERNLQSFDILFNNHQIYINN